MRNLSKRPDSPVSDGGMTACFNRNLGKYTIYRILQKRTAKYLLTMSHRCNRSGGYFRAVALIGRKSQCQNSSAWSPSSIDLNNLYTPIIHKPSLFTNSRKVTTGHEEETYSMKTLFLSWGRIHDKYNVWGLIYPSRSRQTWMSWKQWRKEEAGGIF